MKVKCVICGHQAVVNPVQQGILCERFRKMYKNYPKIWICDTHDLDNIEYIEL